MVAILFDWRGPLLEPFFKGAAAKATSLKEARHYKLSMGVSFIPDHAVGG